MLHILTTDNEIPLPVEEIRTEESADYEIVLGRRQLASVLFVATVVLVTFSAIAYLAGKDASPKRAATIAIAPPAPPPPLTIITPPEPTKPVELSQTVEPPLLADPELNAIYLQMGAVERGIAVIFAEGLRKRGLPSFVAPGPDQKIFRVLIGPLRNPEMYRSVKVQVDALGLATFAKKYVNQTVSAANGNSQGR